MIRPHTASDLPPGLARLAAAKVAKIDAALA
jgi:hypothetical protein